jgi:hypothetical protein
MKRIFWIVMSFMMLNASMSMAQDKTKGGGNKRPVKTTTPENAQATPAAKTKKDGTPDMRYSENKNKKAEAAPAGPLKKDGTPDMRHKANKKSAATKQN